MDDRERLIELGWRQGVLLKPEDGRLTENAHYDITEGDLLLIVSQTCDLVQGSFDAEPYFETLCIHPLEREPNGAYLHGKNSRHLEFSIDLEGNGVRHWYALPYERHINNRRILLEGQAPGAPLNPQDLKVILTWLSRRYTRTAFPEEFVKRCKTREKQLSKNFSRLNPLVSDVYIRLGSFEELEEDRDYIIDVMLLMKAADFDDNEKRSRCEQVKKSLEDQINNCPGVVVDSISIESSADLTIEELNGYRLWDYSYLSFRDPDSAATPVEI